jgi:hypothetical protein
MSTHMRISHCSNKTIKKKLNSAEYYEIIPSGMDGWNICLAAELENSCNYYYYTYSFISI